LRERGFEVFDYLSRDDVGVGEVGAVFEAFVFEPEDVEVQFVALGYLFVSEALEALGFLSLVAVLWIVARNEIVEVAAL
jgi:hypothetical protein